MSNRQNFIKIEGKTRSGSEIPEHTRISIGGNEHKVSSHKRKPHYVKGHLKRKRSIKGIET